jgi:hypothetical protein
MAATASPVADRQVPQRFPVRTWLIAFAGWMFDFYDLVLFSFLLIPIGRDLALTEPQEAVLLGVALGASGIGGILFGYLSDVYGRKKVMMWTICLYSLGTALTAFATGPWSLLVFRLLTGLGVGGEWAVGHALLAEATPAHLRGRAAASCRPASQSASPWRRSSDCWSRRWSAGESSSWPRLPRRWSPSWCAGSYRNRRCGTSSARNGSPRPPRWPSWAGSTCGLRSSRGGCSAC